MSARRLISGTGSKSLTGGRGVENVGKQTRSDPMQTVHPGKSRSDSPEVSSRETEKISLSHEAKQAHYTLIERRSLSHDAKQVRYTCNIRLSSSHEARQSRYTCNICCSVSHETRQVLHMKQASFFKLRRNKRAAHVTFVVL